MRDEILEIVDEKGRIIGTAARSRLHNRSYLLHKVVHVLLFNADGELLLQKRSRNKDLFPCKWDISVGGHIMQGEDTAEAAIRETKEELGFIPTELLFLYSYIFVGSFEKELVYTYSSTAVDNYEFNREEIEEVKFWNLKNIENSLGSGIFSENLESEIRQYLKKFT